MYPERYEIKRVDGGSLPYAVRSLQDCTDRFGMIAVDCETTGLDPKNSELVLLTIATPDTAWVFTPGTITHDILAILDNRGVKKLAQYAPFDWGFVKWHLDVDMYPMWDTRRAVCDRHRRTPKTLETLGTSLHNLAKTFLNIELDKSMQTSFVGQDPPFKIDARHIEYAGIDALILWPLVLTMLGSAYALNEFALRRDDLTEITRYLEGRSDVLPQSREYGSLQ